MSALHFAGHCCRKPGKQLAQPPCLGPAWYRTVARVRAPPHERAAAEPTHGAHHDRPRLHRLLLGQGPLEQVGHGAADASGCVALGGKWRRNSGAMAQEYAHGQPWSGYGETSGGG
jgi:hypothetical protein